MQWSIHVKYKHKYEKHIQDLRNVHCRNLSCEIKSTLHNCFKVLLSSSLLYLLPNVCPDILSLKVNLPRNERVNYK